MYATWQTYVYVPTVYVSLHDIYLPIDYYVHTLTII